MEYKSTERNLETQISNSSENSNQKSKLKITIFIIIIIFLSLVIICLTVLLIYFEGFKNKQENNTKEEKSKDTKGINDNEITNKNKINTVYQIEEGKNFSFFNNDEANLKSNDFIIIQKFFSPNNLRNLELEEKEITDINFTPNKTGNLTIEISFNKKLRSLKHFFKDNKNLLKIDLKDFDMEEVESMESTFNGCSNLFEVDLDGVNSQNLIIMNNTFEKCKKLKTVNLSLKNTSKYLKMNNIFCDCENLEYINLSSLQNVDDNMFKGFKSKPTIYANDLISNKLDYIFHISLNLTINIIVTFNNSNNDCIKGKEEKCKDCSIYFKKQCATCNDGYYLPFNSLNREKCLPCNIVDNCVSCIGNENNIFCFSCKSGFNLNNNKCEKVEVFPEFCKIGENELCKSCKSENNLRNECDTCNEGYYLATDSEKKFACDNCNKIKFCIECYGTMKNPVCLKCQDGYKLENNSCLEKTCIIGTDDKCKACKKETGKKMECETCNEGYYLEENKISYKCSKCSTKNCKNCYAESGYEICTSCENNFILVKDDNDISFSCICPTYYELTEENICLKTGNWIEADYYIHDINYIYDLNLLYNGRNKININDVEAYINNTKIQLSQFECYFCYDFSKSGYYKIKINFKTKLSDMYYLFSIGSLRKLRFLPGFDSSKVTSMHGIFNGQFIEYLDLNYLNTDNVINMQSFASNSQNLVYLDLSKFNTSKLENMRDMFSFNSKLKEIDFSSFDTSRVTQCESLFQDYPKNIVIKISNKFIRCKEFIPIDFKVINIDELACKNFEHCKECKGSKSSLTCTGCEFGYELRQNKCVIPNCTIGINEKCKSCNQNTKECLSCNSGYYLPINSINKTICTKCKIENCEECDNITGNCIKCKFFYKPILDEYNSKIILCKKLCEFGEGNKCSSCDENKENKCLSCNFGYKLMKNGTCSKIENSINAMYNIDSTSKYIRLIGSKINFPTFELSDLEIFIDSNKIDLKACYYLNSELLCKFPNSGLIEVKIIIKKTLTSLSALFSNCEQLVSVNFSETFDTSYVLNLECMFMNCISLKNADLSSFNTTLVSKLIYMFNNCHQLTSIDLSNFDTRNVLSFQDMFINNYNLRWVDISNFNTSNSYIPAYADYLFKGVGGVGTIIINKKSYNKDIPSGWNIIYKD